MLKKTAYYFLCLIFTLAACNSEQTENDHAVTDTANKEDAFVKNEIPDTVYIAIADTGNDYVKLRDRLLVIGRSSGLMIDTMRHTYFPEKDKITLPDDDPDTKFAGNYEPRYGLGEYLSIEYLNNYSSDASAKTMAIVAGIHEYEGQAWAALRKMKKRDSSAFVLPYAQ